MEEHQKVLLTLHVLSEEAKTLIQTFQARINTLYDHKKFVGKIIMGLDVHKKERSEEAKRIVLDALQDIQNRILPAFAPLHPDIAEALTKSQRVFGETLQNELHDFQQLEQDLKSKTLGPAVREKLQQILETMRAEIQEQQENVQIVEHLKDAIRLAEGFVKQERQLMTEELELIQRTQTLLKVDSPERDYDGHIHAWKTFIEDLDTVLRQEKTDVVDHIEPLFKERPTIAGKIKKLFQPFSWIRERRMPTPDERELLGEGALKKITWEDIARDVETFTTPAEVQEYQSFLMRHFDLLDEKSRKYITLHGLAAAQQAKVEMRRLSNLAYLDQLTGMLRKVVFDKQAEEELSRADRFGQSLGLLFIDIDHFKQFNDRYGHPAGNAVLQLVATIIKNSLREGDVACRWGGEELAVLLPNADHSGASKVAEKIREAIQQQSRAFMLKLNEQYKSTLRQADMIPEITVSIGVASFPTDGEKYVLLLGKADARLYVAKNTGRNQVVSW